MTEGALNRRWPQRAGNLKNGKNVRTAFGSPKPSGLPSRRACP